MSAHGSTGFRLAPAGALLVALAATLAASGCGYALAGRGSFLPAYIQTIGVPLFVNRTTIFDIEELLTQRVRAEFIGRGRYKVMPTDGGADATLTGEITSVALLPSAFNDQQQATRYLVVVTLKAELREVKENRVLWENPSLVFREEYEQTTGSGALDPNAFFGQASNALDRMATDFAKTVVTSILEAF